MPEPFWKPFLMQSTLVPIVVAAPVSLLAYRAGAEVSVVGLTWNVLLVLGMGVAVAYLTGSWIPEWASSGRWLWVPAVAAMGWQVMAGSGVEYWVGQLSPNTFDFYLFTVSNGGLVGYSLARWWVE